MRLFARMVPGIIAAMLAIAPAVLAKPAPLLPDGPLNEAERRAFANLAPAATANIKLPNIPSRDDMTPQLTNTADALGMPFSGRLAEGYAAFMAGDIDRALAMVDAGIKDAWGDQMRFRLSLTRVDLLSRTDRFADAEASVLQTAALEREFWGEVLFSRAVRGTLRARLGDEAAAEGDLARVALALKSWQLPLDYDSLPNITDITMKTDVKFRAALGLASLYMGQGRYAEGLAWAVRLERHFIRLFALASSPEFGDMVPMIPEVYLARGENMAYLGAGVLSVLGRPDRAEPYFAAAEGFFKAMGYAHGQARTAALKARALYDSGRFEAFETAARPAIALAAEAGLGELVWRLEALRGEQFFHRDKMDLAEAALRRAQDAVTLVSGALASDQSKLRFGVGKERLTELLAAVDLAKGNHGKLFQDMEQGRARAFVDMLADQAVASGDERDLMGEIRRLERDVRRQCLANATPGTTNSSGMARVETLLRQRGEAAEKLRQANPELADTLSVATVALGDVQARLRPGEVLAYAVPAAADAPLIWLLIDGQDTRLVKTAITQAELADRLEEFVDAVALGAIAAQVDIAASLVTDLELAQWGAPTGAYVVPAGHLHSVPWGALDRNYFIAVLPTGGWLNRPAAAGGGATASIIGDPKFFGQLPQLPGARDEAAKIAAAYGVSPLLGAGASEEALRKAIGGGVGVLHLATHGLFDAEQPLNSAIMLSGRDGVRRLTAARLFEAPLRANLVVLSACETGVGRAVAGNDYLGLTRSFYLGGARTVLNSLWSVQDKGTQAFMTRFHAIAQTGPQRGDYGAAWLAARDAVKKLGYPPAVYGAFILGGSARP